MDITYFVTNMLRKMPLLVCPMSADAVIPKQRPEHLGCFSDQALPSGGSSMEAMGTVDSSVTDPAKECKQMAASKGYLYAALQSSTKCSASLNRPPSSAQIDDSQCDSPCPLPGDGFYTAGCGGTNRSSVYSIGGRWC
jgi:hypothetical protein